ncbi:glycerol-3-phosphate dehydrogenase/oxidase [Carnobacterium maltaromaticum]|uniref:glycerol-3-phosphate dehydrogenase/oxidase n=1 Tax=Carnobacterium maltaromaticum TaxID=2751 RepID=UPI000704D229|nr:FAD-dependent oxidoreductase [Carnobacterium maltaromaticum]KRN84264.1 glycerol-3-phosphate dehydrogenase [Carnobacterium maltaromaticum]TFJ28828.1 glycerol-3-phosphate dehydrogenase/oxidase [Carnobacterium maltaromaticum]TFJ32526.1 glycerol-3-phosphate dehydrogenase/oxidase [Carnobacterium maltaromaticum]TFJ36554.1 glycerol-3-phosphate dehydrogenase/oxidase [Carnobacterium maltaromaticum]TFJ39141.1 glycerol-3-phosphate dehydrogenase/oxidase [Carnobacterium maltaromaticum]
MMKFSKQTRQDNIEKMQKAPLDLLVIGGGITGAGITLDAQDRGLQVGVLEMRDFASGTSSRSTKLVHGGLRYLKQFEIKVVQEVGQERAIVYENAPHVTTPLWMVLPFYKGGTFGSFTTAIGLEMYDHLAKVKKNERRYMLKPERAVEKEPYLKKNGLKGAGVYVEYRTDDARLTIEVLKKAAEKGAYIANYVKVERFIYDVEGRVKGVYFHDELTGETGQIYAKKIINASGPWVDDLRELDDSKKGKTMHLTKGVHLVIDESKFPISNAIYFDTPFDDKRMMFAIPREGKTYIGTTDTNYKGDPKEPGVTLADVEYILAAANQMFDITPIQVADVESSWSGVRPLIHEEGKNPSEISRKDEIFHSESGLFTIAGGKLTGYRKMSEKVVDQVMLELSIEEGRAYRKSATKNLILSGGDVGGGDLFDQFVAEKVEVGTHLGLDSLTAEALVHRYGSNVDEVYSYLKASQGSALEPVDYLMLHYGLEHEMVIKPIDYLLRRSSQLLFDSEHAKAVKELIVDEMAEYYDWDEAVRAEYLDEVEQQLTASTTFN